MIGMLICVIAFVLCFYAGRRSITTGILMLLGVGYLYGIIRANIVGTPSYFLFDVGVLGLYLAQLPRPTALIQRLKTRQLKTWVIFLIGWPFILTFIPLQDPLVQLVGLRGHVFFVPFLLLGARLERDDLYKLALGIAGLNLMAFAFAMGEFFFGIGPFFPRNTVTQFIYQSYTMVGHVRVPRIPACFSGAHAYANTMVFTVPLLVGAWVQRHRFVWHKILLMVALLTSIVGVFVASARSPVIILIMIFVVACFAPQMRLVTRMGAAVIFVGVFYIVSGQTRLQRFMTLKDSDLVSNRIVLSANKDFWRLAAQYPFGNGLGGGGTSMPYFLQGRIRNLVLMENEYARIMLEQGMIGLIGWIAFIIWVFFGQFTPKSGRTKGRKQLAAHPARGQIPAPAPLSAIRRIEARNGGAQDHSDLGYSVPLRALVRQPATQMHTRQPLGRPGTEAMRRPSQNSALNSTPPQQSARRRLGARITREADSWKTGRLLIWMCCFAMYATAFLGLGLLASVPSSVLMFLYTGWIAANSKKTVAAYAPKPSRVLRDERELSYV